MDRIEDMLNIFKSSFKHTVKAITKNPILLLLPIVYSIMRFAVGMLGSYLPSSVQFLWGFIYALILSLILSSYYYQLNSAIYYNRVNFRGFKKSFYYYSSSIYYVFFINMLINIVLNRFLNLTIDMYFIVSIIIFLALNAIPETIYVKGLGYQESFSYNFRYLKENWYLLFIPTIIYLAIAYYGFGIMNIDIMELHYGANLSIAFYDLFRYGIFQIITAIYVVFRGFYLKKQWIQHFARDNIWEYFR